MLIGLDPNLTPDLLYVLALMGHGDEIVLADRNFPASSTAAETPWGEAIQLAGLDAEDAARTICSVMPLDSFGEFASLRMEVDGEGDKPNGVHEAVEAILTPHLPADGKLGSLERQTFYAHAKTAFAVVQCAEARPYGCFILRKGVVFD